MDFSFGEMTEAVRGLAKQILTDLVTDDSLRVLERDGQWFHRKAWEELAKSELLGLALPESVGGGGMGLIDLFQILHQVGRTAAPVPALATLVTSALPIAEFGTEAQQAKYLGGVASGEAILTTALLEPDSRLPTAPATRAEHDGERWRISGTKHAVPWLAEASWLLVPAATDGGIGLFVVDPMGSGVSLESQVATNDEPLSRVTLDGALADGLIGDLDRGAHIVEWMLARARLGGCAVMLGAAEAALFMTAKYTAERQQFGVPIGSFQAVKQRAGDMYIDVQAMTVTLWQAAWRLSEGLDASKQVEIACFWAADGGHRVVVGAQHLHGGMGFDRDYPLYRLFLLVKQLEFFMGGASGSLSRLGELLRGSSSAD